MCETSSTGYLQTSETIYSLCPIYCECVCSLYQLCVVYKQELVELPNSYRSLCEALRRLLAFASSDKPLILLLDGVDELSPEDGALGLSWLPLHLPEHVKIVLSTSSETKYSCFPVLQSLLSNHQENFIEVIFIVCLCSSIINCI